MKNQIDATIGHWLARWVAGASHHARMIIVGCTLLTLSLGVYAALHLGVNSDNVRMVSEDLPSRQNHEAFARLFPNLENALLVVVEAKTPELAREASNTLAESIRQHDERFTDAYLAGGSEFFEVHGLLYRNVDELDIFGDQIARLQPMLVALEQDASIANLANLISQGLDQFKGERGDADPAEWAAILDSLGSATIEVYTEFPLAVSWEEMMLRGSAVESTLRRVIVVHPILDFASFLPAGSAIQEIRAIIGELQLAPDTGVTVRITGNPAINYEEMFGLAWDLGGGGVLCFGIVVLVLWRALRSIRLVAAAVVTLLMGLVWTTAFAAFAVGDLSLVSAAFGILCIGLGVDFAIHLGMSYAERMRAGQAHLDAIRAAASTTGSSLAICTVTTAIGFYVFVPTDYLGVAELGLIAGTGMFIIFALTLTLFPALLTVAFRVNAERDLKQALHFHSTWWRFYEHHSGAVCIVALIAFVFSLFLLPESRFDANVIQMRDPTTESVQAFNDLLEQSGTSSPWYVNSVAKDLAAADALAERMGAQSEVLQTITLSSYVPDNQEEKLEVLGDIAFLLDAPPASIDENGEDQDLAAQIDALRKLRDALDEAWLAQSDLEVAPSARVLRGQLDLFLERVDSEDDPTRALDTLATVLLSGLPEQLSRIRAAVNTDGITLEELPNELVERMMTADGRARVQTFPIHDLSNEKAFTLFTEQVQSVDPKAAGVAINLVAFAQATKSSFRQALISALVIISLMLVMLWGHLRPMLLVMSPLVLSSVLTVATMVLLGIPFNFANIIVIPLLLGIGVDSGVHLVHRAKAGGAGDLMDSTTARAVFYSAFTTTISFGTLALSSHRGVASLGIVLSIGMVLTVICNLIVLPALITRFQKAE